MIFRSSKIQSILIALKSILLINIVNLIVLNRYIICYILDAISICCGVFPTYSSSYIDRSYSNTCSKMSNVYKKLSNPTNKYKIEKPSYRTLTLNQTFKTNFVFNAYGKFTSQHIDL